jgi:nuclear cap-binding protein subunit 1
MSSKAGRNRNGAGGAGGGGYSDDEEDDFHNKSQQRQRPSSTRHHHHHHHRSDRRHIQQQNQPPQQQQQQQQQPPYDPNKRRKLVGLDDEELTEEKLQLVLFSLGQKFDSSFEQTLRDLCTTLCNDLTKHKKIIFNILNQCIQLIPERLTIYSTLVGLLHASVITFGSDFLDTCVSSLKEYLLNHKFESVQRYVRFLSDLINVKLLSSSSILALYETFIDETTQTNVPQVRTDFFVSCILISLPYSGKILSEKHNTELNRLLYMIDKYVYKRSKIHVPILQVWTSNEPHPQEEYLDCLWAQIKRLNQDEWAESQIFRPYYTYADTLFSDISASIVHDLPTINIPKHTDNILYPLPKIVFRMFDYTDVPEQYVLPGAHAIERYLIEDEIANIIHTYHMERKDCAIQLTQIRPKNKIPLNYMIIEVIFGHLFMLPRPPHLELFYGSLLLELCKLQPSTLPPVLVQAVEMLFERLNTMKTSCIERFVKWFSYHLSNFQFTWGWQDWIDCLDENPESPKIKFIRETFQRCMRLSFHQRVIDFVPEQFYKLVPNKPSPVFKFEESDPPVFGSEYAQLLNKKIKERAPAEDILRILNTVPNPSKDDSTVVNTSSDVTYTTVQIDLFVSSLLWIGSKSFTHSFASLAKYHQLFKILIETEEQQIQVLKSMYEIWPNHQQV